MTPEASGNISLSKIGVTNGLVDLATDESKEATQVRLHYDTTLRQFMRRFPWATATKYADLLLVRGPFWNTDPTELTDVQAWLQTATYVPGDVVRKSSINYYCILASLDNEPPNATYWSTSQEDAPDNANGDWLYAYRYPVDCLKGRRIVPATGEGRAYLATPPTWRAGRDVNGLLIYTNEQAPELEYTALDCDALFVDDWMVDAFTWLLASKLAPALARNKMTGRDCWLMYRDVMRDAGVLDAQEQQQEPDGESGMIGARG